MRKCERDVSIPFKREGVSEPESRGSMRKCERDVSIPFKREGVSERHGMRRQRLLVCVSIPFKRDGVSERDGLHGMVQVAYRFYSLQTGRRF